MNRFLSFFSTEKNIFDQFFYVFFYVCLSLLPPLIGIVSFKTIMIPFMIVSVLVILRFFMRLDCKKLMLPYFKSPPILLLLTFVFLIVVHATIEMLFDLEKLYIFRKAFLVFFMAIVLVFVWSHKKKIDKNLFLKMLVIGFWGGFIITLLKIIFMSFIDIPAIRDISILYQFLHIHNTINGELVILCLFSFVVFWNVKNNMKKHILLAGLYLLIFFMSFFAIGFSEQGNQMVMMKVLSETILFAIPLVLLVLTTSYYYPKQMTNMVFTGVGFVLISAPWLFQMSYWILQKMPWLPSARKLLVRGEIWSAVAQKIFESPFYGLGIDAIRTRSAIDMANDYMPTDSLAHTHNMFLQAWFDLGMIGVSIMLGIIYLGWRTVRNMSDQVIPSILSALIMLFVTMMVTHSLWASWFWALTINIIIVMKIYSNWEKEQKIRTKNVHP